MSLTQAQKTLRKEAMTQRQGLHQMMPSRLRSLAACLSAFSRPAKSSKSEVAAA